MHVLFAVRPGNPEMTGKLKYQRVDTLEDIVLQPGLAHEFCLGTPRFDSQA